MPVFIDENGFNDHTVPRLESVGEFGAMAATGVAGNSVVKFTIPDLTNPEAAPRWMDSNFFALHDEWYWFRLLNGQPVPNIATTPVSGLSFETIDDIYDWADTQPTLPLDLEVADSRYSERPRIYSPRYYRAGLDDEPRNYGLGSVIHISATDEQPEWWLLELEATDDVTPEEVAFFFDALLPTLPAEIGDNLRWVVRSEHQDGVGREMADANLRYGDRVVRYDDVVPDGQVTVYNEGIAAGRLLYVGPGGDDLSAASPTDIVIAAEVPDFLPPAAALVTDAPQTPLAHVNLLAKNRGMPNASRSGISMSLGLRRAAQSRQYAVVEAVAGEVRFAVITKDEFETWQALGGVDPVFVPTVDLVETPTVVDLMALSEDVASESALAQWRPVIGGKSAGFLTLLAALDGGAVDANTPHAPLAITVEPYFEFLQQVQPALSAVLANPEFRTEARARFLLLEGREDFDAFYVRADDQAWADNFERRHPRGTLIGDVLDADGFKKYFRARPIPPPTLETIVDALEDAYGSYEPTQGLRFRSSSSVEDIEGFNGAGLYDSNTGYLRAGELDGGLAERTVEWAIKKTWASYWGFEAFEERERERVDHRTGGMAVLVHARMDDELEQDNGVATFTLLPASGPSSDTAVAVINVQLGSESVTNPDVGTSDLPEVIEVRRTAAGAVRIERLQQSTLAAEILDDEAVIALFGHLEAVTTLWIERQNDALASSNRASTLTLDSEFKHMGAGWPAIAGDEAPERLIVKQARSLEPGLRPLPPFVRELDAPRDVLARARLVQDVGCGTNQVIEVFTDPLVGPDMGYADSPLVLGDPDAGGCFPAVLYATPEVFLTELLDQQPFDLG